MEDYSTLSAEKKAALIQCFEFRREGQLDGYLAADGHGKCATAVGTAASLVAEMIVNGELK